MSFMVQILLNITVTILSERELFMSFPTQILFNISVVVLTAICAFTDLTSGKIYNKVTYYAVLLAIVLSIPEGVTGITDSLAGLFGALLLFAVLYKFGVVAAGDVKLMAAVGALKGFSFVLYSGFYAICFAGLIGLALLIWKGRLVASLKWMGGSLASFVVPWMQRPTLEGGTTTMPFAPPIFLGVIYALWLAH